MVDKYHRLHQYMIIIEVQRLLDQIAENTIQQIYSTDRRSYSKNRSVSSTRSYNNNTSPNRNNRNNYNRNRSGSYNKSNDRYNFNKNP